jgi:DNA-directed RNA polymerase subunit M/transcription elongation factor TFIIS
MSSGIDEAMAETETESEASQDPLPEATIEPFLDMRDPTFRRILRAATSKFNQMICPLMASVCVRDLCMFWNEHSQSCYIVDGLKNHLYHMMCPKCQSTNVQVSTREARGSKTKMFHCVTCGNEWSAVH